MKIWIDVLTGKQLLFAESMINKLSKRNKVLCTTRDYRELNGLVKIRKIKTQNLGKHGGGRNLDKLIEGTKRIQKLTKIIDKFNPDLAISFQSPEAARVAFGLRIRHIGFADSAHASSVMKLTIPFLDKLLIPWIMKKENFAKYGISKKDIIQYKTIDAALISKRSFIKKINFNKKSKIIVIRMAESHASYNEFTNEKIIPIIHQMLEKIPNYQIIVSARYSDQIKFLKMEFGNKVKILDKVSDSKDILRYADVFVGSGGTMTAEAAFLGIPTISYSKRMDYEVDAYLEKKKIVIRESNPNKIPKIIEKLTGKNNLEYQVKVKKFMKTMEDPFCTLENTIKLLK